MENPLKDLCDECASQDTDAKYSYWLTMNIESVIKINPIENVFRWKETNKKKITKFPFHVAFRVKPTQQTISKTTINVPILEFFVCIFQSMYHEFVLVFACMCLCACVLVQGVKFPADWSTFVVVCFCYRLVTFIVIRSSWVWSKFAWCGGCSSFLVREVFLYP